MNGELMAEIDSFIKILSTFFFIVIMPDCLNFSLEHILQLFYVLKELKFSLLPWVLCFKLNTLVVLNKTLIVEFSIKS